MKRLVRLVFGFSVWRNAPALAWIIFALSLVVFLVQSRHLTKPGYEVLRDRAFLFGGDEPWYLLTTRSIAVDLDYNLIDDRAEQEFWNKDISGWSSAERLIRLGHGRTKTAEYWKERVYPVRPIGLPIVLAPAYRVGLLWDGQVRLTCVWFMCLVGALLVQQMFLFGLDLTGNRLAAFLGALAGGLSMPTVVYVTQIYMDLPAALLIVVACRALFTARWGPLARATVAGVCTAYLPWLHEKYDPLAVVLVAAFLVVWRPWRLKRWAAYFGPIVVSVALLAAYYVTIYGVPYPVYDHRDPIGPLSGIRSGYFGMLFDRTDGLVPYWPVAAFAIAGLVMMARERRPGAWWMVGFTGGLWLLYGAYPDWTGGMAAPVRYWLPVVPLLVVGSIYALARMRRRWLVVVMGVTMLYGVVIGARSISHPRALMKDSLPFAPSAGTTGGKQIERLYHVFPDMKRVPDVREPAAGDYARGVAWLVVLGGVVVLVVWLQRGPKAEAAVGNKGEHGGSGRDVAP